MPVFKYQRIVFYSIPVHAFTTFRYTLSMDLSGNASSSVHSLQSALHAAAAAAVAAQRQSCSSFSIDNLLTQKAAHHTPTSTNSGKQLDNHHNVTVSNIDSSNNIYNTPIMANPMFASHAG